MPSRDTFEDFYKNIGLSEYPFSTFNAENEKERNEKIFITPQNHSIIMESLNTGGSVIIVGERGTGKTALSYDIQRNVGRKTGLLVNIDDFSSLENNYTYEDYYNFLTKHIASAFFIALASTPLKTWKYSREERVELSFFLQHYVKPASKKILEEKIIAIQNCLIKRFWIKFWNVGRGLCNYGISAAATITKDLISSHFTALYHEDERSIEYFKKLELGIDTSFDKQHKEFFYLSKLCKLIKKSNFINTVVLIDKVDEDPRFENDAEKISNFIKSFAADNKTLLHEDFCIALFMWSVPFNYLKSSVRTNKLTIQKLAWGKRDLKDALNRRLEVYSSERINSSDAITEQQAQVDVDRIFEICNENPRDLWHLYDAILQQQFRISPKSTLITSEAISLGIHEFVKRFNFYEYYPKKANSRSNSMDVYSYIKHLTKLGEKQFTKDQLNRGAGTGSSTNNYVVAMENMGLIVRADAKDSSGAALYKIKDPKVIYAIDKNIEIERSSY